MSMEKCIRKDELYHDGMKLFLKDFCIYIQFKNGLFQLKAFQSK